MKKLMLRKWESRLPYRLLSPDEIGELKIAWPVYEDEAHLDQLTGLPNRRGFVDTLSIAVKEAAAQVAGFGLIIFDIDHFKAVNDTFGHVAGDNVLREFAGRISGSLRATDFCARYGGEEFILLTVVSPKMVFNVGERVRMNVKQSPFDIPNHEPIVVTCSFGAAAIPLNALTAEDLVEKADQALYRAKEQGRDRGTMA